MILWIVLTLMIAVSVAGLAVPLVRRHDRSLARQGNIAILKDQLAQIDSQERASQVTAAEAEGMRAEVGRRILAEGRVGESPSRPFSTTALPWAAVAIAAVIALSATGLYALVGHPGPVATGQMVPADSQASDASANGTPQHPIADVSTMVAQLEAKMKATPNDPDGWRMLGWSYLAVNRPADAATAYGRAADLDPTKPEYRSAQGDALVQAAKGQVTPDAVAAFQAALKIDPADARARYFLALSDDQQGRRDQAMAAWIGLLKSAPPGASWEPEVRRFVLRVAQERHIDLTGKLPPEAAPPPTADAGAAPADAAPGPTPDQVQAAGQMPADQQSTMIRGMVDKLAGELKANPRNADGWQRLMRARMVLGDGPGAASAYGDARKAFADSPAQLASLREAAQSLGIPGA